MRKGLHGIMRKWSGRSDLCSSQGSLRDKNHLSSTTKVVFLTDHSGHSVENPEGPCLNGGTKLLQIHSNKMFKSQKDRTEQKKFNCLPYKVQLSLREDNKIQTCNNVQLHATMASSQWPACNNNQQTCKEVGKYGPKAEPKLLLLLQKSHLYNKV